MADKPNNPTAAKTAELDADTGQQEGYADAEPVSPDENPGDASKELNEEAAKAYAEAGSEDQYTTDSKGRAAVKSQAATARAEKKSAKAETKAEHKAGAKH